MSASEELHSSERWTLTPDDHSLIAAKSRANRLGFAVLLLFFREHGRFPADGSEADRQTVGEVARQVHVPASEELALNLSGRTAERHRAKIRAMFGYREATVADTEALEEWLRDQAAVVGSVPDHLAVQLEAPAVNWRSNRRRRIVSTASYEQRSVLEMSAKLVLPHF